MLTLISIERIDALRYGIVLDVTGVRRVYELAFDAPPRWTPEDPEPDPDSDIILVRVPRGRMCGVEFNNALSDDLLAYNRTGPWDRARGAIWIPVVYEIQWQVYAFACGQPVSLPMLLDKRPGEPDPDGLVRRTDGPVLELRSIERVDDRRCWVELDYEGWPLAYMYEFPRPPTWDPNTPDPDDDARSSWPATPEARARFAGGVREPMHARSDLLPLDRDRSAFGALASPLLRRLRLLVYAHACDRPPPLPLPLVTRERTA